MSDVPSATLARDAASLAKAWMNLAHGTADAANEAAAILARADPAEQPLVRDLCKAYEAMHWVICRLSDPACQAATETLLQAVRERGWPRAVRLAEVAWAWARAYVPDRLDQALALLAAQHCQIETHPTIEAGLPLMERFWRDPALSALYCVSGDYERSLLHALRAEAVAEEGDAALLRIATAHALVFVYLSVGDIEGACAVLPPAIAALEGGSQPSFGLSVNYLLALVVSRRFEDAAQLLLEQPELLDLGRLVQRPALKAMVARVRLAQGRVEEASDLPELRRLPFDHEVHTMAANRIWISADVLVGLGRAREARVFLHEARVAFAKAGIRLMPMNATQWHRALADACEVDRDLPAAMAALRESQVHSFNWLGASMRARLQALHFAAPGAHTDELQRRQRLRLQMVDQVLATARQGHASSPPGPPERSLVAQVTHEVRNPIHGVIWMTSLLMASDLDERQRKYLELASSSARMALNLCNDVLDLAKLEAGRVALQLETLDLGDLVAECVQVFEAPARAKGVDVHCHRDPALPAKVCGDRMRLKQVLLNLLSNATKFTQAGRIDVGLLWLGETTEPGEPTVRLSVTDTGPGISPGLMPRLFHEFEQGEGTAAAIQGSAGLGLALCRQFVQMMGGEIGVNNRSGHGCTFWCLLPLQAP